MPAPQEPQADRAARCRQCGYDLRGHSADPVRCPECATLTGQAFLRGDVYLTAHVLLERLSRAGAFGAAGWSLATIGVIIALRYVSQVQVCCCWTLLGGGAILGVASLLDSRAHFPDALWLRVYSEFVLRDMLRIGGATALVVAPIAAVLSGGLTALVWAAVWIVCSLSLLLAARRRSSELEQRIRDHVIARGGQ